MHENTGEPQTLLSLGDGVLRLTFNRARQRNAMTWQMYGAIVEACERADADDEVSVLVLDSSSEAAFVAGTDIAQFQNFATGADGLAYETRITEVLDRLETVSVPTLAVIRGFCVGGGLGIAASCDLRVASRSARFGVPIARTLGNCLSSDTVSRLLAHFGAGLTSEMLVRGRLLTGEEAATVGFVGTLTEDDELGEQAASVVAELRRNAPLSMWAAKELIRRARTATVCDDREVVERVYGSADFRKGVAAFVAKRRPVWRGV